MADKGQSKKQEETLGTLQSMVYGVGNLGVNTAALVFASWTMKRYCPPEEGAQTLLPVLYASALLTAAKLTDGTLGPLLGYWSDNISTRWGRRMPFILFGTLPMCIFFMLTWVPPLEFFPPNSTPLLLYYGVVVFSFWILYTSIQTPLFSLLPEIAVTDTDRMNLATYQSIFIMVSSAVGLVGAPIIKDKFGYPAMGLFFFTLIILSIYPVPFVLKERYRAESATAGGRGVRDILATFGEALGNKPFSIYIASKLFAQIGFQAVIISLLYIVPTIFNKPDTYIGIIMGGLLVCTIISFFVIKALSKTVDKRKLNIWGLALMVALLPSVWFLGKYDMALELALGTRSIVISELVIGFVIFSILGFSVASQAVLMSPMIADATDLDEIETGRRREAVYFGLHGMVLKYGTALANLLIGVLFNNFGYSVKNHGGVDLVGPAAAACILVGLIIFLAYPIDKKKEEWIRTKLAESRNGTKKPGD